MRIKCVEEKRNERKRCIKKIKKKNTYTHRKHKEK